MKRITVNKSFFLLLGVAGVLAMPVNAQDTAEPSVDPSVDVPDIVVDEFDRGTPLRSVNGFNTAAEKGDYETAAEYLDLRNLRGDASELTGPQLARRLSTVVKRANWIDVDELLDHPDGRRNDNLPRYRDSIGVVLDEGKELRLLMQKVPRGDGAYAWKVSNATVSLIPELYEEYGYPEIVEDIRRKLPNEWIERHRSRYCLLCG